jgi:hypothetical protein
VFFNAYLLKEYDLKSRIQQPIKVIEVICMNINKYEQGSRKYSHFTFDSMTDAMDYFQKLKSGDITFNRGRNQSKVNEFTESGYHGRDGGSWTGYGSETKFNDAMKNGDMEKAHELWRLESPELIVKNIRRRVVWGEIGDSVDVQKMYKGEFDKAWRSTKKQKANGGSKNITLLVNLGANCGVSSEKLGWRGMASLKIADCLSEAGYNVRLLGYSMSTDNCDGISHTSLTTIPIKDFDEGMDVPKLASIMCRAGFFRTAIFCSYVSCAENYGVSIASGLGRSRGLDEEGNADAKFFLEKVYGDEGQMISIPTVEGKESALKEMNKILDKYREED